MTSKTKNPRIPGDLGLKMGSPAMKFWQAVIDTTDEQIKAAADAMTYQSAVFKMAQEHYSKAKQLYNRSVKE